MKTETQNPNGNAVPSSMGYKALLPLLGVDTTGCEEIYITVPQELADCKEWVNIRTPALRKGLSEKGLVYHAGPFIREVLHDGGWHYIISVFGKQQDAALTA